MHQPLLVFSDLLTGYGELVYIHSQSGSVDVNKSFSQRRLDRASFAQPALAEQSIILAPWTPGNVYIQKVFNYIFVLAD